MSADPLIDAPDAARLLAGLGSRVRDLRARRKMTRRALSRHSGVSERYLAQLELGRGNISVVLLARIAAALRVELSDLLLQTGHRTPEAALITHLLDEVGADTHRAILRYLADNESVPLESRRRVALVGLRGAGKTSLGGSLARRIGAPFVQLGTEIESLAGMSTPEIFSLSGPAGYRRLQEQALMQTLGRYDRCVLETPGSIVMEPKLLNTLLSACFVAWLHARPEEYMRRLIAEGDVRPMQNQHDAMADLRRIVAERADCYARAHVGVDTNGKTVEECVAELARQLPEGIQAADEEEAQ